MLASPNRRDVLQYFRGRGEQVATTAELVDCLVAGEDGPEDPHEAAVVLHHRTLPRLAETGAIDYDYRTKVTRYRGHDRLEALLPTAPTA